MSLGSVGATVKSGSLAEGHAGKDLRLALNCGLIFWRGSETMAGVVIDSTVSTLAVLVASSAVATGDDAGLGALVTVSDAPTVASAGVVAGSLQAARVASVRVTNKKFCFEWLMASNSAMPRPMPSIAKLP